MEYSYFEDEAEGDEYRASHEGRLHSVVGCMDVPISSGSREGGKPGHPPWAAVKEGANITISLKKLGSQNA
ncbi:hypothetical protein EVAR_83817_1 [Eumeta japonica]|uniref:Uncharacterized protein n=1 Tax=Eumeta variegata TaxID=151549 RepID=A0A4C1WEU4_EUMVA|nr:hypothetical protein EVAR_83817_1 [Eumeta japonica]